MKIKLKNGYIIRSLLFVNTWFIPLYIANVMLILWKNNIYYSFIFLVYLSINVFFVIRGLTRKKPQYDYIILHDTYYELINRNNVHYRYYQKIELSNPLINTIFSPYYSLCNFRIITDGYVENGYSIICDLYISYKDFSSLKKMKYKYISFQKKSGYFPLPPWP